MKRSGVPVHLSRGTKGGKKSAAGASQPAAAIAVAPVQADSATSKTRAVCDRLTTLARELGPDAKLPTFVQMRNQLGVSAVTLTNALDALEAQQVVYRRHGVGIFASPKLWRKSVALVCEPSFFQVAGTSPFWQQLVSAVTSLAEGRQVDVSFHFSNPDEKGVSAMHEGVLHDIRTGRIQGVISIGGGENAADLVRGYSVPFVSYAGEAPHMVVSDHMPVITRGVEQLGLRGCRRIALWNPISPYRLYRRTIDDFEMARRNTEVFASALAEHGIPFVPELVDHNLHLWQNGEWRTLVSLQEQGYQMAYRAFREDASVKPDGIISTNDVMTHGALIALRELGIRVGRDIPVVSHANVGSPALLGDEKDLILVEVDPREIVQAMFEILEALMDGQTPAEPRRVVVARLRERPQ
jgi:Transcriptional regulators